MQKRRKITPLTCQLVACAFGSLGVSQVSAQNYEFVSHTVEAYGSSGMCSGDALTNANEDDEYFDNGFGSYQQWEHWSDGNVDGRDFTDSTNFYWGSDSYDPNGTDFADAIFFSGHSDSSCTSGAEKVWLTMGDTIDGCSMHIAHATGSSRNATWGGGVEGRDANAVVTFACETTQYCVFTAGAYAGLSATGGEFNILNGFHGLVYEVSGYQSDLGNYSNDAVNDYIGDAWLDWMYDTNANGSGADNCPSAIGFGANTGETDDFYSNAGWQDFHANGARTISAFYKLCGCDPVDGAALPSC